MFAYSSIYPKYHQWLEELEARAPNYAPTTNSPFVIYSNHYPASTTSFRWCHSWESWEVNSINPYLVTHYFLKKRTYWISYNIITRNSLPIHQLSCFPSSSVLLHTISQVEHHLIDLWDSICDETSKVAVHWHSCRQNLALGFQPWYLQTTYMWNSN